MFALNLPATTGLKAKLSHLSTLRSESELFDTA